MHHLGDGGFRRKSFLFDQPFDPQANERLLDPAQLRFAAGAVEPLERGRDEFAFAIR